MKLLIVIPTYNEIENITSLISSLFDIAFDAHILVIDDNSPDGTAVEVKKKSMNKSSLYIIEREGKQGVASAFLQGFSWGIDNRFDVILAMDADFSHDPKYIPMMLKNIENADLVIGSRNVQDGCIKNRNFIRNIFTKFGSLYCRIILKCPIKDFTGGYNMWRRSTLEKIGMESIISRGYSFQIEMKYKTYRKGCRIVEVPIIFQDRKRGKSKMSSIFLLKALRDVWRIRKFS